MLRTGNRMEMEHTVCFSTGVENSLSLFLLHQPRLFRFKLDFARAFELESRLVTGQTYSDALITDNANEQMRRLAIGIDVVHRQPPGSVRDRQAQQRIRLLISEQDDLGDRFHLAGLHIDDPPEDQLIRYSRLNVDLLGNPPCYSLPAHPDRRAIHSSLSGVERSKRSYSRARGETGIVVGSESL
jgi:hypothetical protein